MRTLKKSLSLVLVLAMVFSFCVMGTNAAFADADEITVDYAEAVEVMNALEILKGDEAGFRPADTLTRAEACVIIVKMLGAKDLVATAKTDKFDDIAGHWGEKYIAYCVEQGLISGNGDGTFAPDAELSGYAFALMVLRAAGYDPKAEGVGGSGWELATTKLAKAAGLVETVDLISAETFTREMAAQMAYDGLMYVEQVRYEGGTTTIVGGVEVTTSGSIDYLGTSMYMDTFGGKNVYLLVTDNDATNASANGTTTGYVITVAADGTATIAGATTKFNIATGADEIGKVVNLYYKSAYTSAARPGVVYDAVVYSAEYTIEKALENVTEKKAEAAVGFALTASVAADKTFHNYAVTTDATPIEKNGEDDWTVAAGTYVFFADQMFYLTKASAVEQVKVTVTNADKGYYTVGTTSDADKYIVVAEEADDCFNKLVVEETDWLGMVKKGQSTAVAMYVVAPCGDKYALSDVATIEGKVTLAKTGKISVDGKAYEVSTDDAADAEAALENALTAGDLVIGSGKLDFTNTFTFYLDTTGKIFAAVKVTDEVEDTNKYELAYIVGTNNPVIGTDVFGTNSYAFYAQYYTTDGAVNTAAYTTVDGKAVAVGAVAAKGQVEYAPLSGWYFVAETENGLAIKGIVAEECGYTTTSYTVPADGEYAYAFTANTTMDYFGNLINSESVFVYSDATVWNADNEDGVAVKGAHASGDLRGVTVYVITAKNASNSNRNDLVAAYVVDELPATEADKEVVYVVSYDGQLTSATATAPATYSYTVITEEGKVVEGFVTNDNTSVAGSWREVVTLTSGAVVFGAEPYTSKIQAINGLGTGDYYTTNGNKYIIETFEYNVNNVVIIDLRAAVLAGAADAITSVDKLVGTFNASALYTVNPTTYARTATVIVIGD